MAEKEGLVRLRRIAARSPSVPHLRSTRSLRRTTFSSLLATRVVCSTTSNGGEGGIRTPGTVSGTTDFESVTFGHSATSPYQSRHPIESFLKNQLYFHRHAQRILPQRVSTNSMRCIPPAQRRIAGRTPPVCRSASRPLGDTAARQRAGIALTGITIAPRCRVLSSV